MKTLQNRRLFLVTLSFAFYACNNSDSVAPSPELEIFAQVNQGVGNIAYTHSGQLVWSNHPFFAPQIRVVSYDQAAKTTSPFPNEDWNTEKQGSEDYLDEVLGIRNDDKGIVWMLDMGTRNNITPKLVGWNTNDDKLERVYPLAPPATLPVSQPQDLVIDYTHNVFVIADEGIARGGDGSQAALIVVDMETGDARRILEGDASAAPDTGAPTVVDGRTLGAEQTDGNIIPLFVGADGIALDKDDNWLYYAPLNGDKVYRLQMDDVVNTALSDAQLSEKVETYSDKENNGGISIDEDNNLYLTNIATKSVGFVDGETKKLSVYASHNQMLWPDGISYNKDGYMYIGASQIYLGAPFNNGEDKTTKPFYIFRVKPTAKGIFGR